MSVETGSYLYHLPFDPALGFSGSEVALSMSNCFIVVAEGGAFASADLERWWWIPTARSIRCASDMDMVYPSSASVRSRGFAEARSDKG